MRTTIPLCLLALVVAGCGGADGLPGGEEPPTAGALVAESFEALVRGHDRSARFKLRAEGRPELTGPAAALGIGDRLSVEIEGAASAEALTAKGKVEAGGESFEGELRAGDGFYLRVGDDWYGTPDAGPGDGDLTFDPPPGVTPAELSAALREAGDGLVDGEVDGGPEIGGDETWQVSGTVNPDAAVAIGRRIGAPISAADEAALRSEADEVHVEYAVGRDDWLPRRIALSGALARADLPADLTDDVPLESLELELELELSDWGTPVVVQPPERYTSFEELIGSFFAGSGLEVEVSPGAVPGGPPVEIPTPEIPPPSVPPPSVPPPSVPAPTPVPPAEVPPPL